MASRYSQPPDEALNKMRDIIAEHHGDLHAIGVKIDLLFAYGAENDDGSKSPAIMRHGYQAGGLTSIINLKNRVKGQGDGEILIDGDAWLDMTERQKEALIDHELTHFVISRDHEGGVIRDTHGRPKLKMKLHDREFGWFDVIAERYGIDSGECFQAKQLFEEAGQLYLPFTKAIKPKAQVKPAALQDQTQS